MKKSIVLFLLFTCLHILLFAQSSFQGINYQAVARNAAGIIVGSQPIKVRFSIITGNANGTVVYSETHAVTTTAQGLFTAVIGKGTPETGTFAGVNWATSNHFLKVDVDIKGGNNFSSIGTTPFYSVPFALFAANNMVGPQGPQGIQGIQGPVGPQGAPGSTWQISSTTFNANGTFTINTNTTPATITSNNATWLTRGNTGTNAANDYIGTNDAQPFVIKANGERMRLLNTGQIVMNGTSAATNRLLSIYGTGTPQALNANPGQTDNPFAAFSANNNTSVYGQNTGGGIGLYGENTNTGVGVRAVFNGPGSGFAIKASATGVGSEGLEIINSGNFGLGMYVSAYTSQAAIMYGQPQAIFAIGVGPATNTFGGRFEGGPTYAMVGGALSGTNYGIVSNGAKSTVVKDDKGESRIMFCPEAPEVLFQDYGEGNLQNGFAHVTLDNVLVKNIVVDAKHPLKVFIQLEGDCNGVFVTNKNANGFDVKELQQGKSNVSFTWQIVATRADDKTPEGKVQSRFADLRFPVMPLMPKVQWDARGNKIY